MDDAQNVRVDTARGKDNDQQNPSKMTMSYCSVLTDFQKNVTVGLDSKRVVNIIK